MRIVGLAAAAAGICFAGAAAAAEFHYNFEVPENTPTVYILTFSDVFSGGYAAMSTSGYYLYSIDGGSPGYGLDSVSIACAATSPCTQESHGYYVGGFRMEVTPILNGFEVWAANTLPTVDNCAGATQDHQICGQTYLPVTLTLGAQTEGKVSVQAIAADVPEPATWAMMIAGFGLVGSALRSRKTLVAA